MEQGNVSSSSPLPTAYDRETFQRVWRRVMPQERPECPIEVEESTSALAVPAPASPAPVLRQEEPGEPECGVPCLGEASAVYGPLLQRFIDYELADCRAYQGLSRRAPGNAARVLSGMAADEHRHAKRLSTAYFLISGVRYWPAERGGGQPVQPFLAALREHFGQEQRGQCAYLAAAEETTDPCLRELYLELAGDEESHAGLLRSILEQM